jgi:hypothetical protein
MYASDEAKVCTFREAKKWATAGEQWPFQIPVAAALGVWNRCSLSQLAEGFLVPRRFSAIA